MYTQCLLCNHGYRSLVRNGLPLRQCISCGLVWRETFDRGADDYEVRSGNLSQEKVEARIGNAVERMNLFCQWVDFDTTCDIGCGEGVFLNVLKEAGYRSCFGIEPNVRAVNFARSRNLEVEQGTVDTFPREAKGRLVHTVTLFHVIEHLENPLETLRAIKTALPEGASIVLETPDIDAYQFRVCAYNHPLIYEDHLWYFNTDTLMRLLVESGFTVTAHGRRDFGLMQRGIKSLLTYYGLGSKNTQGDSYASGQENSASVRAAQEVKKRGFAKTAIANVLRWGIRLLGRENYIWAVAKKP